MPDPFKLIPAAFTPFHEDGSLNLPVIGDYAPMLSGAGCAGTFVCGTAGECASLNSEERRAIVERWMEAASGDFEVYVHVGHCDQREAVALAAHAAGCGAAGVGAMAPWFQAPQSQKDLIDFLHPIAEAAEPLPFYYYHFPAINGVALPMATFLEEAMPAMPNFAGLKYTHENLVDFEACLNHAPHRLRMYFGRDELILPALSIGARAAIGSTYSYAAPLIKELIAAWDAGDAAQACGLYARSNRLIRAMFELPCGYPAAAKGLMALLGLPLGPTRPPLRPLDTESHHRLQALMQSEDLQGALARPLAIRK